MIIRLFAIMTFFTLTVSHGQDIKMMTYNIKYDNVSDTVNNWNFRKEAMVDLVKHYQAEVVGMQEVLRNQLIYLDSSLNQYSYVGVGRDDGKTKGEYAPIFYDGRKLKVLKSNTFWLSETPEKVSKGWDASLERICTYALFENLQDHKRFWVFNTHFDHRGKEARANSTRLVIQKIKGINTENLPVAFMGDLNLAPEEEPIRFLQKQLTDGQMSTRKAFYGPTGTSNGFDPNRELKRRIDYIFVNNFKVESYIHIDDRMENNKHISDHLPVFAKVSW
ncbi:endonuclease/exonuclease/phosphatase family protein [uncultured Kriegella sp.]|uniref:endonuclease/exonuclease/phosphatase family protein n=1 Tax=uncultured Kriegella sp. TaxID=1798910 RepID=UPI0030DC2155|tara:strand:- start:6586 stop:7416 length:831 start_codon:yes stop_codon:yes gene_type:complete